MEENKNTVPQPTPIITPPVAVQNPVGATTSTPPTAPPVGGAAPASAPVIPPTETHKNKGLIFVAIILTALIILLVALYFVIIKQSSQETTTPITNKVQTIPTPKESVTPTATEEEEANKIKITDPTDEVNQVTKDANGL